ncbi:MAG: hypothetical protein ACPG5W_06890, partial [Flavobacteriales bacterium]
YNLPNDIASTTLTQYVQALASDWFPANYLLDRDFTIEYVAGDIIRFTAKEVGTSFAIAETTTIPSGHAVWSVDNAAVDWEFRPDFTVLMDVEVEEVYGSNEWIKLGPLHADPIVYNDGGTWKGDVKIDVQEMLDGVLQNKEDSPTIGSTTAVIADKTNLQWRAIYVERYTLNGEVFFAKRTQIGDYRVLKGGMDYRDYPALGDLENAVYDQPQYRFNTFLPTTKRVTAEEEHFLYYLAMEDGGGGSVAHNFKATVFYTNGSSSSPTSLISQQVQQKYETYILPCGFNAMGLDALSALIPYKYTVKVSMTGTGSGIDTETRTFWLEGSTRQDRFYHYENSAQGWGVLRTNGTHKAIAKTNKVEGKRMVQDGYGSTDANLVQKSSGVIEGFEVFIGPKPKDEFAALRDFMNAERHYEIIDGKKVPIIVDTKTWKLEHERTGDYTFVESFKYRFAFINKGFSRA